ncbi:MAG: response regulator [Alphaproteobacteria bacterium]|nr:response regulator [Alphaproteobacteria bacterium]|tara:strand:+ start:348 stop:911 length:564 start_codon:yes stop_codon:yes gene_type:complete
MTLLHKSNYGTLRNFTVLVVEDYGFMADLISSMLREFGIGKILIAENGEDAKDLIRFNASGSSDTKPMDIVLTDWLMPEVSGVELLKWIRSSEKDNIRFLPVVLLSAYTSEKVVSVARDNGANEAIVKPVSGKMLADRILHIVNHPRAFVKTPDFFGPDRRRKDKVYESEDRRKLTSQDVKTHNEQL